MPNNVDIAGLFADLPDMKLQILSEPVHFEDGLLLPDDRRGKPHLDEQQPRIQPVFAVQARLRSELVQGWFSYSRAVCFGTAAGK
jgi:hypothetical protein